VSRSCRKTPIVGITTARSEKGCKRAWHSRFRALKRQDIEATDERLASNPWAMAKDGRQWVGHGSRTWQEGRTRQELRK
jgi:hypothetical protein